MATSNQTLANYAQQLGLNSQMTEQGLMVMVPAEFRGVEHNMSVLTRTYDEGQMFEVAVAGNFIDPELNRTSKHQLAFLFYLLHTAWNTKFGTPEVGADGEVRLLVEFPLIDAELTLMQFKASLAVAAKSALQIAIEGSSVLQTGTLPFAQQDQQQGQPAANEAQAQEEFEKMARLFVMMTSAEEGRAKLKEIVADNNAPQIVRDTASAALDAWAKQNSGPTSF